MTSDKLRKEIKSLYRSVELEWVNHYPLGEKALGELCEALTTYIKEREGKIREECKFSSEPRPCECYDIKEQIDKAREEGREELKGELRRLIDRLDKKIKKLEERFGHI